jgi:hypothetical protein
MKKKAILAAFLTFLAVQVWTQDASADNKDLSRKIMRNIFDVNYRPDEKLTPPKVFFDFGGSLNIRSRVFMKEEGGVFYFNQSAISPVPADRWFAEIQGNIGGKLVFLQDNYFRFSADLLLNYNKVSAQTLVPGFNVNELFINWIYPLGRAMFGRNYFTMKNSMIFSGLLDGVQLDIIVPFLNFRTFLGFSGFTGIFFPNYNHFNITEYDRSFVENVNLLNTNSIVLDMSHLFPTQSRRLFFATDFDIYLVSQHINPYFLMQLDLSAVAGNQQTTISTFHLGLNLEGKIVTNFSYQLHVSGLFGTNQDLSVTPVVTRPIVAAAGQGYLKLAIPQAANSMFQAGYLIGTGSDDATLFTSDDHGRTGDSINQYYYFGKTDGGFVLNPVLSNLQIVSLRYSVSPVFKGSSFRFTWYLSAYQSFKLYPAGSISDPDAINPEYPVAFEADTGIQMNFSRLLSLSIDFGLLIPETAYSYVTYTPRLRGGITMGINF